jgi:hypothetical protein
MPGKISDEIDEIEEIDVAIDDAIANESHDWSQTRTLYVILQGEFCLYRQRNPGSSISDTLHIVAPHIPHHQYKAGPWLSDWRHQTEVPCSPLRLRHAFGDRKQGNEHACRAVPESNLDIITSLGIEAPNPEDARVHITARMPLAILPGVAEHASKDVTVEVTSDGVVTSRKVPTNPTLIAILVYKWYSGKRPYLWSPYTRAQWHPGGPSEDFLSLHAYASSPREEDENNPEHARKAFRAAAWLLGEDAHIHFNGATFTPVHATPPAGLSWAQVNLLFSQVLRCHPFKLLTLDDWFSPSNEPLTAETLKELRSGASSGNCGPLIGG